MDTILIAGGAGFIGSNLIQYLLETRKEVKIVVVDNLITGSEGNIPVFKNVEFVNFDITDSHFIEIMILHYPKFTEIWNFACPASPRKYREFPLETIAACTTGVRNLCELALYEKSKFIHASTSEVYGQTMDDMEESNPGVVHCFGPRSCYDEGKRIAETIIMEYINTNPSFNAHIARLFNTYGPKMQYNDGRVIPNFITRMLHSEPVYIFGSYTKTRSFCYVEDTIRGMEKLLNSSINTPVNIGSDDEMNLKNLFYKIKDAMIFMGLCHIDWDKVVIKQTESPKHDPDTRRPILTKAHEELGYYPECDIDYGLRKTIEYYKEYFKYKEHEDAYASQSLESFKKAYDEMKVFL